VVNSKVTTQYYTRLKRLAMDEDSGLVVLSVTDAEKKFTNADAKTDAIHNKHGRFISQGPLL
jgi:hypothetical protein